MGQAITVGLFQGSRALCKGLISGSAKEEPYMYSTSHMPYRQGKVLVAFVAGGGLAAPVPKGLT